YDCLSDLIHLHHHCRFQCIRLSRSCLCIRTINTCFFVFGLLILFLFCILTLLILVLVMYSITDLFLFCILTH
ncbi:hypothetical protein Leryth_023632, partial [Lithospermum erythrorhizon]